MQTFPEIISPVSFPHHWRGWIVFFALILLEIFSIVLIFLLPDPVPFLGGVGTMLVFFFTLAEPLTVIYAIIFVTFAVPADIIGEQFIIRIIGVNFYAMDWLLLIGGFSLLLRYSLGVMPKMPRTFLRVPVAIFLGSLFFFAAVSLRMGNGVQDVFADVRLFFYYISFFLILLEVRNAADIEKVFWAIVTCGLIGSTIAILHSLSDTQYNQFLGRTVLFHRITGSDEINYPMLLIASLCYFPYAQKGRQRYLLVLAVVLSSMALFLSFARGSWLAAGVGFVVVLVLFGRHFLIRGKGLYYIVLVILLLGAGLALLTATGSFTITDLLARANLSGASGVDISSIQRLTELKYAFELFLSHPILGAGIGYIYQFYSIGVGEIRQIFLHNSYLWVLSKMGLVGFALFLWLFLTSIIIAFRTAGKCRTNREQGLLISFTSIIIVLMIKATTTWHLNVLTDTLFIGVVLGIIGTINAWVRKLE